MSCSHEKRLPYDCGCTFGPPSCTTCNMHSECAACGKLLGSQPNARRCGDFNTGKPWSCQRESGHEGEHR